MKKDLFLGVFILSLMVFIGAVFWQAQGMPERVASHWNAAGIPNGWMPRAMEIGLFLAFGLGLSLFVPFIAYTFRWFPPDSLNVPNSAYWRAPEHYPEACEIAFRSSLWTGAATALWAAHFHGLIAAANRKAPPMLDAAAITHSSWILIGVLLVWTVYLWRRFSRIP